MTNVTFDFHHRTASGSGTVTGVLTLAPSSRFVEGGDVVVPRAFTVTYDGTPLTLDLVALPTGWCWRVAEYIDGFSYDRYILPDPAVPNYADLPDIDPDTLAPTTTPSPAWVTTLADELQTNRLDRQTQQKLDRYNRRALTRVNDATVVVENWTSTAGWGGTGAVQNGVMYGASVGLAKAINVPAGGRFLGRFLMTTSAAYATYKYIGISSDAAGAAPSGATANVLLLGISGATLTFLQGSSTTGSPSNLIVGTKVAGDYICTVAIDEDNISFSLQARTNPSVTIHSLSYLRSQFNGGGAINNLILSSNDPDPIYGSWGPGVMVTDMLPPAPSQRVVNGVDLFGSTNPIHFNRRDPLTGVRHLMHIPGDWDPRRPLKIVEHLHWSLSGNAATPYVDARMTNVFDALLAAGYAQLSSDNGPSAGVGGVTDRFGTQVGTDDYNAAVEWCRARFYTGAVCLLGASQGGQHLQNIIASRLPNAMGGIAAAASICPSTDLIKVAQLPAFASLVLAAWGVSTVAQLRALLSSNGLNPIEQSVGKLAGVPQRFYAAGNDEYVPVADHITPIVAKVGAASECSVDVTPGVGHLDASTFKGADLVTFFDRYTS